MGQGQYSAADLDPQQAGQYSLNDLAAPPSLNTESPTSLANKELKRYGVQVGSAPDQTYFLAHGKGNAVVPNDRPFQRNMLSAATAFANTQTGMPDTLPNSGNSPVYDASGDQMRAVLSGANARPNAPGIINGTAQDVREGVDQFKGLVAEPAQMIGSGDIGGGVGTGAVTVPMFAAGAKSAFEAPIKGVRAAAPKISEQIDAMRTSAARSQFPELESVPDKAILGADKVFRAAAPVGSDPQFRQNLYKASGDLAEIGRKVDIAEAKGGILQPDMRVRATVDAINDHMQDMYQTERAPQIAAHADNPVISNLAADSAEGLKYLARRAGTSADRALALKALQANTSAPLTLAETDQLGRLVNKEMLGFQQMTPAERAAASATNSRLAGLKSLDQQLTQSINGELQRYGEPGISEYEQRMATLAAIRDQLQTRMNAVELQQGMSKIGSAVKGVIGGPKGIASASQAAVANVNIGKMLQDGLRQLADSGITANKGTATPAPQVRGLLTPGAQQMPQGMEPLGQPSPAPQVAPTMRAERLGLLLPEQGSGKIPLPASNPEEFMRGRVLTPSELNRMSARQVSDYLNSLIKQKGLSGGNPFAMPPSSLK